MITNFACIQACCDTYNNPSAFDKWFDGSDTDEVVCGLKFYDDCVVLALRGSTTFLDWIRDFNAAMIQTDIGGVEAGFYIGQSLALSLIVPLLPKDKKIFVTGHSLGGGRAQQVAAKLIKQGFMVSVVTFGSPRPGDSTLAAILATVSNVAYKNGPDYVTEVPIPIHPLLPYVHPSPWVVLNEPPRADDDWGLLGWHHSELYLKALYSSQLEASVGTRSLS